MNFWTCCVIFPGKVSQVSENVAGSPLPINPVAAVAYVRFYAHSNADPNNFWNNLEKYGRRPLGFCHAG